MLISDLKHGPSETVVAELRDYPEWHRQRQRYGVWIIPVNDPVLLNYIEAAQAAAGRPAASVPAAPTASDAGRLRLRTTSTSCE
jgi:hypothetical protein